MTDAQKAERKRNASELKRSHSRNLAHVSLFCNALSRHLARAQQTCQGECGAASRVTSATCEPPAANLLLPGDEATKIIDGVNFDFGVLA